MSTTNKKTKGVSSLLKDRDRLYTEEEVRKAVKDAVFTADHITGNNLTVVQIADIIDSVCDKLKSTKN